MLKLKLALAILLIIAALVVSGCCCCFTPCGSGYKIPRYSEAGSAIKTAHVSPSATKMPTMLPI